ncbi:MAG: COX15/CtaA family protein [Bacteroidia bacterium]
MGVYQKQRELNYYKPIIKWLYLGIIMVFIMVMIGGITRLTDSGLSMVDWKPIMGTLPPLNQTEWIDAFDQYKNSPQFKDHNYHFELSDFKQIYFWEYVHRVFGRLIGLVFIIPFLWFLIRKKLSKPLLWRLILILTLGSAQGFLGWFMVKSGLIDIPEVSHFRLAAHLITAFVTMTVIYWVTLELKYQVPKTILNLKSFKRWNFALLAMVLVQILYGAFVAGKDAGLMHNTWPLMNGHFVHPAVMAIDSFWYSIGHNKSTLQFIHRSLAIVIFVFVISLKIEALKKSLTPWLQNSYTLIAVVVLIQFLLGIFTLIYKVPISIAVLHQLGALVLLLGTVRTIYFTKEKEL